MKLSGLKVSLVTVLVGSFVHAGLANAELHAGTSQAFIGEGSFRVCGENHVIAYFPITMKNARDKALAVCEATTGKPCEVAAAIVSNGEYHSAEGRSCAVTGYAYPDPVCK